MDITKDDSLMNKSVSINPRLFTSNHFNSVLSLSRQSIIIAQQQIWKSYYWDSTRSSVDFRIKWSDNPIENTTTRSSDEHIHLLNLSVYIKCIPTQLSY